MREVLLAQCSGVLFYRDLVDCGLHEMITIQPFEDAWWPGMWAIMEPVFRAGETYVYSPEIGEAEARKVWEGRNVVGTYFIKPNQPGLGAHVCNCGYIVASRAAGRGIASQMCDHSQARARELGYLAMQYNLVVSTNERAVRLWRRHGFDIVGTLPGAFRHQRLGFVDAHVMFKRL